VLNDELTVPRSRRITRGPGSFILHHSTSNIHRR
jgi:hypothetical protein